MTTNVQVYAGDVRVIAGMAESHIAAARLLAIDKWVTEAMQETKPAFLIFGSKPRYATRMDAILAMRKPFEGYEGMFYYGNSYYTHYSRYHLRTDERRLKVLAEMAQSSIDGTLYINDEDHALLRKYAPAYLWHTYDTKEVA